MSPQYLDAAIIAVVGLVIVGAWRFLTRSVRRELQHVITETIQPELERIHERIDSHMESEEGDLKRLISVLAELAGEDPATIKHRITGD
jgi:sensor domain CHASE-containing protein